MLNIFLHTFNNSSFGKGIFFSKYILCTFCSNTSSFIDSTVENGLKKEKKKKVFMVLVTWFLKIWLPMCDIIGTSTGL
jgi:hypothetical protein